MGGKKKTSQVAPIFAAAKNGSISDLVACLKDDPGSRDSRNKDGWTPLHQAAYSGQVKIVTALIKAGAKVNSKDHDGDTPLHYASAQASVDCIKPLVDAGADLEARDQDGESPLDVAPSARVKLLLRKLGDEKEANDNNSDNDWEEVDGDEAESALAALELGSS
mmetsp:Transcript_20820/g.39816  ORF Transcript_20820/g.39816 Transcript_20820/m.39816 type:complete len:164 (-) Transcript_20820:1146-1637(-)